MRLLIVLVISFVRALRAHRWFRVAFGVVALLGAAGGGSAAN